MHVAHIGGTGKVGVKIRDELLARGHRVTLISRHPESSPEHENVSAVRGDITAPQALAQTLAGHDAIVSSATFVPGSSRQLLDAVLRSGVKRYIAVGGAGSLEAEPGKLVKDMPGIPPEWMPAINEGTALLTLLRANHDLEWTFFSPAASIGPGKRTGEFRLGGDRLVKDRDGKSTISYDDYAIALVDELEKPKHIRKRFTIGY